MQTLRMCCVCGLHGYTIVCVSGQRVIDRIQSRLKLVAVVRVRKASVVVCG